MNVTINTDASFHSEYKVGAYAFWIVSDCDRIKKSGALKLPANNPTDAEFKCIMNAMAELAKAGWVPSKVFINTDSMDCVNLINRNKANCKKYNCHKKTGNLYNKFKKLAMKVVNSLDEIEARHVRSHQHTNDSKHFVNNWCDQQAKYWLWQKINEIKPQLQNET